VEGPLSNVYTIRQKASAGDEAVLGRVLLIGAIVLFAALIVYLAVRFILLPMTVIRNVTVESDVGLTQQEIQSLMALKNGESFFTFETAAVQKRLEASALVRKARVEKVFPDQLRVFLYRREASALVLGEAGGRSLPVLVDRDGYVFKIGGTSADVDLPVVSGIPAGEAALGGRLPSVYAALFSDLAALRAKSPSLYRLISEVRVISVDGGGLAEPAAVLADGESRPASTSSVSGSAELRLFLVTSPVPVRVRGGIDETMLKYVLMVLDLLSNQGVLGNIDELDFRGGDVVYRMKEG
jgi:cell division protein FtsQ